jgi:hypothetical protein
MQNQEQGDLLVLPEVGEGMYILDGEIGAVVECIPSKKRGLFWLGRLDAPKMAAGDRTAFRVLNVKMGAAAVPMEDWLKFRDAFGIAGGRPAYSADATVGKIISISC